jgi:hypothetical protein
MEKKIADMETEATEHMKKMADMETKHVKKMADMKTEATERAKKIADMKEEIGQLKIQIEQKVKVKIVVFSLNKIRERVPFPWVLI